MADEERERAQAEITAEALGARRPDQLTAPKDQPYIAVLMPDGQLKLFDNPNYVGPVTKDPVVVNLGGGKVAIIDPSRAGPPQVLDLSGKTPGEQQIALDQARANVASTVAGTAATNAGIKTPEEREAALNLTRAQAAGVETPEQRATREREADAAATQRSREQNATTIAAIWERAKADADLLRQKYAAGYVLTEKESEELKSDLAIILEQAKSKIRQFEETAKFEREKPEREAASARAERQVAVSEGQLEASTAAQEENARIQREQLDQGRRRDAAGVLTKQGEQGQANLDRLTKAGVRPSMTSIRMALDPLRAAFDMINGAVKAGEIPQSAVPTPQAPAPPGQAPAGRRPPSAPAPLPRTPRAI